jgi:hypothetical protein
MKHRLRISCCLIALSLVACADHDGEKRAHDASVAHDAGGFDAGKEPDAGSSAELAEVLTSKNDNARTGANLYEYELTPESVKKLKLLATWPVDGELYAQPLVVGDVATNQGMKTLVLAATMNDSLYAFDLNAGDGAKPLWQAGKKRELGTPGQSTRNVSGPNGILSTPVIDKARGLVYLVARDCPSSPKVTVGNCANQQAAPECRARLFAVELATGKVKTDLTIAGSVPTKSGTPLVFSAAGQWNRPALLLEGDQLYVAFGSGPVGNMHEEDFFYHGYLFRYDVSALSAPPAVFATTPNTRGGSVWQGGAGPASDGKRVYFTAANRTLDCKTHPPQEFPKQPDDAEDSMLSLPLAFATDTAWSERVHFSDTRPYTAGGYSGTIFQWTNSGDVGFGSSGPSLIPDSEDLVVSTKGGIVYLLERATLKTRQTPLSPFTALPLHDDHTLYIHSWSGIPVVYGSLVIYRGNDAHGQPGASASIYGWGQDDFLRALRYDYATHKLVLERTAKVPSMPNGAFLSLSAHGGEAQTAVLWATSRTVTGDAGQGHLWAFDARTLDVLFQADTPSFSKFTPPTIARGRVFVPSARSQGDKAVMVYGLH